MTIDRSNAVAQDFFQKCFRGDIASAIELLDPNVTYRVPGSHRLAGTFLGPHAVARHVEELLRETHHTLDVLQWEDWMIGVNNLAALVNIRVQRHGIIDSFRTILLVGMSPGGRIKRIEMFVSDQVEAERFFA